MSFATLFPDADYRHHLSLKRGGVADFFAPTSEHGSILAERKHWLAKSPVTYAGAIAAAGASINETAKLIASPPATHEAADPLQNIIQLGREIEPDIVLLQKNGDATFRVVAGCVCFPSSWSFPEKMGLPLHEVHSVVPDLNASIGPAITRFLDKMQPGAAWERSNWGVSASSERNQHPSRGIARLRSPLAPDQVWLRVEDQILAILPETKALLFGIRIVARTFAELRRAEPEAAAGLRRALITISDEMARYKNIADVRTELADLLA